MVQQGGPKLMPTRAETLPLEGLLLLTSFSSIGDNGFPFLSWS